MTSLLLLETTIRAGECLGPPRDYSKRLSSQSPSLSSPLTRGPVCQACVFHTCCSPDPPPIPTTPGARPGSSAPLFGLLPTLPTPTLASFSRHFPHDSWAAIFRTDLMVSVSSLQSLCASRTRPAPSPAVSSGALLPSLPFPLLRHCRPEPQGLRACFPASWKTPQPLAVYLQRF